MERDTAYQKIETLEGQLAKADRVNQELCKVLEGCKNLIETGLAEDNL